MIWLACATPAPVDTAVAVEETLVPLQAPRLARRLSLDLRGVLPSVDELESVEADPSALEDLREDWLADPRFEDRLVQLFQQRWHTRVDDFQSRSYDFGLDESQDHAFLRAVGEEPLRLMARVAMDDLPWTETVTADWTMVNGITASIWPVEGAEGADWQPAVWSDGRPAAGVLATNGLWWRYVTNSSNLNRGRAATISRLLLCEDVLQRPITLSTGSAAEDPLRDDPYCVGCHSALDPLAASLFGFYWLVEYSPSEMVSYHPERERMASALLEVEPAWYGQPLGGLQDLGEAVAGDPRFVACAAQSAAEQLWRRPVDAADFDRVEGFRQAFEAGGLLYRDLLRAITDDPVYRAGEDLAGREPTPRVLSADLLHSVLGDLGLDWERVGYPLLDDDVLGVRVLAGGVDGAQVFAPQTEPGLTWALVLEQAAETTPVVQLTAWDEAAVAELAWRLWAERPSDTELASMRGLWNAVEGLYDAEVASQAVGSALLRDPRFGTY